MFAAPARLDCRGAAELFVSSKGGNASIGFLVRKDPDSLARDASGFEYVKLAPPAGLCRWSRWTWTAMVIPT